MPLWSNLRFELKQGEKIFQVKSKKIKILLLNVRIIFIYLNLLRIPFIWFCVKFQRETKILFLWENPKLTNLDFSWRHENSIQALGSNKNPSSLIFSAHVELKTWQMSLGKYLCKVQFSEKKESLKEKYQSYSNT